jgi:DNA polymerase-3 subunit delta
VGVVFESKNKRDYELPSFIEHYLKEHQATIDQKAAQMIADHIGSDLSRLTSELDKVLVSFDEKSDRRVTPEVVEKQIGVSKDFNAFELKNAIVNKNVFKANQIVKYFDSNPKAGSIYALLPLLFNFFQNLMIAHYAPQKRNENDIADALDLNSAWGAKDYLTGMRYYSPRKTLDIISKIREIDAKSKGLDNPNTSAGDLMKELIFFILH